MKILLVLEHYHPHIGGVEKMFKSLAEALVEQGHIVRVITTRFSNQLPSKENINGVEIIRINTANRFGFTFFGGFRVFQLSSGFDLIHATSYNAALPAMLAGFLRRKKVLITFHEVWGKLWKELPYLKSWQRWSYAAYERFILRLPFHQFVGVSAFTAQALLQTGTSPKKVSVIYNGLDYSQYPIKENKPNSPFRFLYFGRLGVSKGLDLILDANAILRKEEQSFQMKMILPQRPKEFLKRIQIEIAKRDLGNAIEIMHELSEGELKKQLLDSDAVLVPSYSEGFCFTAAEAVAMKIPVIHSGKGALKEVVSGKQIAMEDFSAKGLADAMRKAMQGNWEEIPEKRFELKENWQAYLKLYTSMLN